MLTSRWPLLAVALCASIVSCTSPTSGITYDLELMSDAGAPVAEISFTIPGDMFCAAIGCLSGDYEWTAGWVHPDFPLDRSAGTLYAQETESGFTLTLTPDIQDYGVAVVFSIDQDRISGRWTEADAHLGLLSEGPVAGVRRWR